MSRLSLRAAVLSCLLVSASIAAPTPPSVPVSPTPIAPTPEKATAAIQKAGGTMTSENGGTTVKITFDKLTDLTAVCLKGADFVTSVEILNGSRCTDRTMVLIATLPNLESLTIHKSAITDVGMFHFKKLEKLKSLYLAESKITDAGIDCLKNLTELEDLDLTDTRIGDKSIDTIKKLTTLKTLALTATKLTDRGMIGLKELPSLEDLNVIRTNVSTQAIKDMEKTNPKVKIRR